METMTSPFADTELAAPDTARPDPANASSSAPILVATDGTESADAAFVAARLLENRSGLRVEVLSVFEPPPLYIPPPGLIGVPEEVDADAVERLRDRAVHQKEATVGKHADWPISVVVGDPAATVRAVAREHGAGLVVTGISRHGVLDRMLGEETAPHIAHLTETPMLAVAPGTARLPRTILVAIDLDSPALPSTPALRRLLSEATTVYFVNAKPAANELRGFEPAVWQQSYAVSLAEAYDRVKRSIDLPPRVFRQLVPLTGTPAKEILSFAAYARVDLIVVGQRRRWMLQRRFGGGLPSRILRGTNCSVLVLPRSRPETEGFPTTAAPAARPFRTETVTDRRQWASRLAELSRRVAGTKALLEIDDMSFGAQAQASDFPFIGADYDSNDDVIDIMLGEKGPGSAHLTHAIRRPTSIDILERADGTPLVLRVANGRGQTLLSFSVV